MNIVRDTTQLFGRIVVGGYFLFNAFHHFASLTMLSGFAASKGVPLPTLAVAFSGLLLAVAGLSILLGYKVHIGVIALVLFFVPVTIMMHNFWAEEGQARMMDMINFMKNFAILGASFIWVASPNPLACSLDKLLAASRAQKNGSGKAGVHVPVESV
jgi:putative oxidoreductase